MLEMGIEIPERYLKRIEEPFGLPDEACTTDVHVGIFGIPSRRPYNAMPPSSIQTVFSPCCRRTSCVICWPGSVSSWQRAMSGRMGTATICLTGLRCVRASSIGESSNPGLSDDLPWAGAAELTAFRNPDRTTRLLPEAVFF